MSNDGMKLNKKLSVSDKNVLESCAKSKIFAKASYEISEETVNFFSFRREEQEGNQNDNNDGDDDDTIKNYFIPISHAVKNAEVRSAAATTTVTGET